MKTMTFLCAVLLLSATAGLAQGTKGAQVLVEVQSVKKEEKKTPVLPPKPTSELLGRRVVYGGFLTDLARAEKKRSVLSLRTPIDPQKDLENLWFYPGTDKIQGVVLFSIKF